ncbi:MAG TPA: 3'-5' exonuclease [Chitinophagaceae bacterium]
MFPLQNILFLDIETASQYDSFESLPESWKELWNAKAESLMRYHVGETPETLYGRAAIYAEFGKVICISCGIIQGSGADKKIILKSFYNEDEKELLQQFCGMLTKWTADNNKYLCAHNGREFDFPYLCRRMTIHGMKLPSCLQLSGKKPWELSLLDTMELWKFGDYKSYTSLNLLAHVLNIPSPKDDMDGSMVGKIYWSAKTPEEREQNLDRISTYCQKDVLTAAQVYLRLQGEELISSENVEIKKYGSHQLYVRS